MIKPRYKSSPVMKLYTIWVVKPMISLISDCSAYAHTHKYIYMCNIYVHPTILNDKHHQSTVFVVALIDPLPALADSLHASPATGQVGYAALRRMQIEVDYLQTLRRKTWNHFVGSLMLDEPLEFPAARGRNAKKHGARVGRHCFFNVFKIFVIVFNCFQCV